jgi:hypothetical protein
MGVKAIVWNGTAMRAKYGEAGCAKVVAALDGLVRADDGRGLTDRVVDVSDAKGMARLGGKAVASARDAKGAKAAVDAAARALEPDYLLLLGAPDTFPHQELRNPLFEPPEDPDRHALSDLPYACEAPASNDPRRFVGPTRVVRRLPDVAGRSPAGLVRLLRTSRRGGRPAAAYRAAFAVARRRGPGSSAATLRRLLGRADDLCCRRPRVAVGARGARVSHPLRELPRGERGPAGTGRRAAASRSR